MARSRSRKVDDSAILGAGRPVEAEEISQEEPEVNGQASVSKAEMVRAAVADGMEKPQDGVDWIKAHYGIDLPKPMWSSYRAQAKARDTKAAGGEVAPRTRTTTQPTGIPAGFSSDIKEIRALVEKCGGADETKEMIGQLSGLLGKYGAGGLGELIEAIS